MKVDVKIAYEKNVEGTDVLLAHQTSLSVRSVRLESGVADGMAGREAPANALGSGAGEQSSGLMPWPP